MFSSLHLRRFKGWLDSKPIRLAPITVFFGTNSSGKTSLLQSILLLKQTADSADRSRVLHAGDHRSLVDLGTPADLIHRHDTSEPLRIEFKWSLPIVEGEKQIQIAGRTVSELAFAVGIRLTDQGLLNVEDATYRGAGAEIALSCKAPGEYELRSTGVTLKRRAGRPWPLPPPTRFYGFPEETVNYYQGAPWLPDLALALERQLGRVHYVGPLREYPQRSYLWAGDRPQNVGTRGEQAVPALLAARADGRKIGRGEGRGTRYTEFEVVIAEWLKRMGVIESFAVEAIAKNRKDYEVRVRRTSKSAQVLITDVGFGVSQLLPVLVQCYYAPPSSTIIFEQPEIHLHPKVAADLADVLIDAAEVCNVQFIVESHSEHFLQRLQRRIAEGSIKAESVALYSCDVVDGVSSIADLDVDEYGTIRKWPKDFFGDAMGEAAARTRAVINRKRQKT